MLPNSTESLSTLRNTSATHRVDSAPPVSVIIPCFNHGKFVLEAIESVEACDHSLFEIIIINDGSTDEYTVEVMKELEQKSYRVVNQQNQGLARSRNKGIQLARGRYILPLDADNKIKPEYMAVGVRVLDQSPEIAVVYGRPELIGEIDSRSYPDVGKFELLRMVADNFIDACAVIRKSALEQVGCYDPNFPFPGWEDWDLWLGLSYLGWKFHYEDALLFQYRVLSNSMITGTLQPERVRKNKEYLWRKHSMLLRRAFLDQQYEATHQPRLVRYTKVLSEEGLSGFFTKAIAKISSKKNQ